MKIGRATIPHTAICDPELTLTMPSWLTAGTGIDAFSHCLEGYLSHAVNPPLDAIAIDGMVRIAEHLPRVIENGGNRESRWQVMMGAVEGGMCMVKGLGAAHALSIPIDTFEGSTPRNSPSIRTPSGSSTRATTNGNDRPGTLGAW